MTQEDASSKTMSKLRRMLVSTHEFDEGQCLKIIESGIDVNARDDEPFLHSAVRYGRPLSILHALLGNGADIEKRNKEGETPLFVAVSNREFYHLQALIARKADVNALNENGTSPLVKALRRGDHYIIDSLIDHGADVRQKDVGGIVISPLIIAVESGLPIRVIERILNHGADVNERDEQGWTALMQAAQVDCDAAFLQALLDKGANPCMKDDQGRTAATIAGNIGWTDTQKFLQDAERRYTEKTFKKADAKGTPRARKIIRKKKPQP
ncbi:MAG: ankyrin repeat domain-containing protein [Alphaproteobacteria bacterium]|nr:ankyrin repeat domain-containing protein [Alphaproteobacteria bacterium]